MNVNAKRGLVVAVVACVACFVQADSGTWNVQSGGRWVVPASHANGLMLVFERSSA